ncbi:MAG: hypothetical protein J7M15_01260, partial [Anaerolineae bacterium]|nr:hypothetical protein [Anaerolineae bacterium]
HISAWGRRILLLLRKLQFRSNGCHNALMERVEAAGARQEQPDHGLDPDDHPSTQLCYGAVLIPHFLT